MVVSNNMLLRVRAVEILYEALERKKMRNYGKGKRENKTASFQLVCPFFYIQSVMVISISYKINVSIYKVNMNIPDDHFN